MRDKSLGALVHALYSPSSHTAMSKGAASVRSSSQATTACIRMHSHTISPPRGDVRTVRLACCKRQSVPHPIYRMHTWCHHHGCHQAAPQRRGGVHHPHLPAAAGAGGEGAAARGGGACWRTALPAARAPGVQEQPAGEQLTGKLPVRAYSMCISFDTHHRASTWCTEATCRCDTNPAADWPRMYGTLLCTASDTVRTTYISVTPHGVGRLHIEDCGSGAMCFMS